MQQLRLIYILASVALMLIGAPPSNLSAQGLLSSTLTHLDMNAPVFSQNIPVDTAVALYASAKGGLQHNWAGYFDKGDVQVNGHLYLYNDLGSGNLRIEEDGRLYIEAGLGITIDTMSVSFLEFVPETAPRNIQYIGNTGTSKAEPGIRNGLTSLMAPLQLPQGQFILGMDAVATSGTLHLYRQSYANSGDLSPELMFDATPTSLVGFLGLKYGIDDDCNLGATTTDCVVSNHEYIYYLNHRSDGANVQGARIILAKVEKL